VCCVCCVNVGDIPPVSRTGIKAFSPPLSADPGNGRCRGNSLRPAYVLMGVRIALKEAIMNRIFASVLLCTLLLVILAFTTACGGKSI
jgi:hypothetical protein